MTPLDAWGGGLSVALPCSTTPRIVETARLLSAPQFLTIQHVVRKPFSPASACHGKGRCYPL